MADMVGDWSRFKTLNDCQFDTLNNLNIVILF